jgi:3-phenylpropionate/cinnamic acid dioxygenase small subunit
MTVDTAKNPGHAIDVHQAAAFIWEEADILDRRDYRTWLKLWTTDGRYVVPIDPQAEDFSSSLNYAYDDGALRQARVERLLGTFSVSARGAARTVRSVSRFRLINSGAGACEVRCAQLLVEHKSGRQTLRAANVDYRLVTEGDALRIALKVVRLPEGGPPLTGVGYIF